MPEAASHRTAGERSQFRTVPALLGVLVAACGRTESASTPPAVLASDDGRSEVRLPAGWSRAKGLNDEADLQISDPRRNAYFIVLTEPKVDYGADVTYRDHARMTLEVLTKNLEDVRIVHGPTDLVIGDRSAVQYEMRGLVDGLRIVYLHTTVDGPEAFHQLVAWTVPSRLDANRGTLEEITNSFRETQ